MLEEPAKKQGSSGLRAAAARFLRKPITAMAVMAAGFAVLFPDFGPKEVEIRHSLPAEACASRLTVGAWKDGIEMRRSSHLLRGAPELVHAFKLAKGEYQLRVSLACGEDSDPREEIQISRRLVLDDDRSVAFDLSGACPCRKR